MTGDIWEKWKVVKAKNCPVDSFRRRSKQKARPSAAKPQKKRKQTTRVAAKRKKERKKLRGERKQKKSEVNEWQRWKPRTSPLRIRTRRPS